jgi:hypothetical protein
MEARIFNEMNCVIRNRRTYEIWRNKTRYALRHTNCYCKNTRVWTIIDCSNADSIYHVNIQLTDWQTNWITNSMELSPSWKASSSTFSPEIPRMLWNLTVHRIHNNHPPVHIVSQINSIYVFHPTPLLSILILPSHLSLSLPSSLFPLRFRIILCMRFSSSHTNHKHLSDARYPTGNFKFTASPARRVLLFNFSNYRVWVIPFFLFLLNHWMPLKFFPRIR